MTARALQALLIAGLVAVPAAGCFQDEKPDPAPPPPPPITTTPPPPPITTTPPPPPPPTTTTAPPFTATFSGVGGAGLGETVEQVESHLGVEFADVEPLNEPGNCGLAQSDEGLGVVVATPGGVQAFVVTRSDVPFVAAASQPVGVGSTVEEVRDAFPQWFETDSYSSLADGQRIVIAPQQLAGRALLLEADQRGIVRQYRVGVDDYALQVDYCTTPG